MIRCKATSKFTLEKFDELENLNRATGQKEKGWIYTNDEFECKQAMADYLSGNNKYGKSFVEILEVIPEVTPQDDKPIKQTKSKKKKTSKK